MRAETTINTKVREIRKLNIEDSILKGKLIFKEGYLDKINRLTVYIFFSPLIILPVLMILNQNFENANDAFLLYTIFPISIFTGLYIFYRNASEKSLIKIETKFSKEDTRKLLLDHAESKGYEIYRKSGDCIILNEKSSDFNESYKRSSIIFIQDYEVSFSVIKDGFRLNLPVLFSHLMLKRDLAKLFKSAGT